MFGEKLALFLHIIGAIGLFAGLAIQIASTIAFRQAKTIDQVRGIFSATAILQYLFPIAVPLIILSGLYLMYLRVRSGESLDWAAVALLTYIVVGAVTGRLENRNAKTLQVKIASSGSKISSDLHNEIHNPKRLGLSVLGLWAIVGILTLMVFKPTIVMSIIVVASALAIGFASAAFAGQNKRT